MQDLAALVARINAATSPAQVGAIYKELVGYDSHADDPAATLEDLRGDALDFVREVCYAESISCASVGLLPRD